MRSTPQLRPARTNRRRVLASTTAAVVAVIGVVTMSGLATASASANVGAAAGSGSASAFTALPSPTATAQAETVREVTADAKTALAEARAALSAYVSVNAEILASGLDVGERRTVDTRPLREQIDRLDALTVMPLLFLPSVTETAADETRRVAAQTASLRLDLDEAQAQKAAEEAAAQAKRQAEEAAAALAAANTPDGAKAVARQMASTDYGWGSDQFSCLESLWNRESGWNYQAYNGSSGATGIPQSLPGSKMASAGADWQTNATTQIRWGLGYIAGSYGSPCSAWGHSQATGWY